MALPPVNVAVIGEVPIVKFPGGSDSKLVEIVSAVPRTGNIVEKAIAKRHIRPALVRKFIGNSSIGSGSAARLAAPAHPVR